MEIKVKHKVFVIGILSIMVLILITFMIFDIAYFGYVNKKEELDVKKNFKVIDYIIKNKEKDINATLLDWSKWDDTYQFVADSNKEYIYSNLQYDTLKTLNLKSMIFLNNDGKTIYEKNYEIKKDIMSTLKSEMWPQIKAANKMSTISSGLVYAKNKVFIVSIAPITKSVGNAKNGSLIMVRSIEKDLLDYIKQVSGVGLIFTDLNKKNNDYVKLNGHIKIYKKINSTKSYKLIKDINNKGSIIFEITNKNNSEIGYYFKLFILSFLLLTVIVILLDYFIVNKYILKRLSKLHEFIKTVAQTRDTTLSIDMDGNDEFHELAVSTNKMIGELNAAYKDMAEISERFMLTMEATNDGVLDFYAQTNEMYISPQWKRVMGLDKFYGSELYSEYYSRIHPECLEKLKPKFIGVTSGKIEFFDDEYRLIRESGDIIWVLQRGKIMEKESRYFIIMGDLNGLKITNNDFGYKQGDKLILTVSEIIKQNCDSDDIISRWGGDEFVILIKNKNQDYVSNLIVKIKQDCESIYDFDFKVSIALGYAEKNEEVPETEAVMTLAETRMYRNKLIENKSARSGTISSLLETLHEKHSETEEHTIRIKILSAKLGKKLKLTNDKLDELELLSILHDIGKIGIPEQILIKPSKLTEEEWIIMKTHTNIGYRIAKSTPELAHIAESILAHHEKYDGAGYPNGLKGEEIPLLSRIINIVDSFDVLTHKRIYKDASNNEYALEELKRCSGTQFDPYIVEKFMEVLNEQHQELL
jgi:diguanylate cyclase (GGDEF)-like protein